MSERDRIEKILKALQYGTESVRRNPSEQNYKLALDKIERAGKRTNVWVRYLGWTISGLVVLFLIAAFYQDQQYQQASSQNYEGSNSFPLSYCGDRSAGGTNIWYPVYIAYSESNLRRIRNNLCCDAFYNPSIGQIQVASFYSRARATEMVAALKAANVTSARVGDGSVVNAMPSSRLKTCR